MVALYVRGRYAYFGELDRLEKLLRAAHAAGADWVKVQKRDVDTVRRS